MRELSYDDAELRPRICDDGKGLDAGALWYGGPDGHGMREHSNKICSMITIWGDRMDRRSTCAAPPHLAYQSHENARFRWWRRLHLNDTHD